MTTTHPGRATGEKGVALILFAISLVALLAVAGLVIDGGRAYSERRQMQNASDASAMAGARELDKIRTSMQDPAVADLPADAIYDAALAAATENDADAGLDFECYIVNEEGTFVTGSASTSVCPEDPASSLPGGLEAAGVQVVTRATQETFLIRVVDIDSFQARADATAQVQGLRGVRPYAAPFMICAFDRATEGPSLLIPNPAGSGYILNPAALWTEAGTNTTGEPELDGQGGPWYKIHGPHVPNCQLDSETWKGLVDGGYTLPGVWKGNNGVKAGPTRSTLTSGEGCAGDDDDDYADGCLVLAPVCLRLSDIEGTEFEDDITDDREDLYCVTFGTFKVVETHSNEHHAALLGDATVVTEGEGGGAPELNEPRLIKLTK